MATTRPMPKLWTTLPVRTGTAVQLVAAAAGATLVAVAGAAHGAPDGVRLALLGVGWLAVYLCSHAVAHVAVGRVVGIRFRGYGVRGTDHPETYPPGIRRLMSVLPVWSALTERDSTRRAGRGAKAAMFAPGETSTTVTSIALAALANAAGVPGAHALLTGSVIWAIAATVTVTIVPKGDYAKALRAFGWRKPVATVAAAAGVAGVAAGDVARRSVPRQAATTGTAAR